jgi:glycosyltransferase involved in cell wall biosynthesis
MKRVALLTTALKVGGAPMQVVALAQGLTAAGARVAVISLFDPEAFAAELRGIGVEVVSLRLNRSPLDLRWVFRLPGILRAWKPDVLHCHMTRPNLIGRLIGRLVGVPVVISTIHSSASGTWLVRVAYRMTDRLASMTTAVGDAGALCHVASGAVRAGRIVIIPNGVDEQAFRPDDLLRERTRRELHAGDDFLWLAAGRLYEVKNYPHMLRSFAMVAAREPRARLFIAGSGPLLEKTRALAREMSLENRVTFLGLRRDMHALMCAADALVLSSITESFPLVLLEASCCRLPMVSSDVGSVRTLVRPGVTGILTQPGDDNGLADAMLQMQALSDAERAKLGRAARRLVAGEFNLHGVIAKWLRFYDALGTGSALDASSVVAGPDAADAARRRRELRQFAG